MLFVCFGLVNQHNTDLSAFGLKIGVNIGKMKAFKIK